MSRLKEELVTTKDSLGRVQLHKDVLQQEKEELGKPRPQKEELGKPRPQKNVLRCWVRSSYSMN